MNVLWSYFWPVFGAGLLAGTVAGLIAFRARKVRHEDRLAGERAIIAGWKRQRILTLGIGLAASLAAAALWHGPGGGADRLSQKVDRTARQVLDYYEMTKVTGHLHRGPLSRRLDLSGPADDFQRSELVRLMSQLPGVSSAQWSHRAGVPLIVEGLGVSLLGFLIGLVLAYLVELRRRYNAQWNW